MNYLQNSNNSAFQPLMMQRSAVNRFIQPQLICVDQSTMNITATAINTIKASTSQKIQRGSRQYIIKYRNSNASATSTSQSPQKQKRTFNNQINIHTEDPYLKENKLLSELSVKVSKIMNKVVSPCSSLSTQSSNKNDQAITDKEDDSPLRPNKKPSRLDNLINAQQNSNSQASSKISSVASCTVDEPFKNKQKNTSSIYSQADNIQKTSLSPDIFKLMPQDGMKLHSENLISGQEKQNDKGVLRNFNKQINNSSSTGYNQKTVIRLMQQNTQENIEQIGQQTTTRAFRNRDVSAPPVQEVAQNTKGQENGALTTKQSFNQPNGTIQKRHSVLRLSDPQTLAAALSPDKSNNNNNLNNQSEFKQQMQQPDLKLLSSTLQQLKFDEGTKKQLILKQGKKNSTFLNSKRKKLKKSKQIIDKENVLALKPLQLPLQIANDDQKCDIYDQDFQSLADQLENQQLFQKIEGNEYMFDDENAYSEELNEQEDDEDYRKDAISIKNGSKKNSKTNNSIILPSLVQIGSNNVMEEQSELQLKSKELEPLNLTAKSVCIYDVEKGKPILSLKGKKSREVASLTKIMTCYIICQAISKKKIKQTEYIKVSRPAASMIGTSAYLRSGDQLTVWDLLHGLMLPSGNDAAFALAEFMGRLLFFENEDYKKQLQSNPNSFENCKTRDAIKCFLQEMNRVAKDLKLTNTKYSNPHGLVNKSNRSSAQDICKLSAHCLMKSSLFRQIVKTKQYTCQILNKQGVMRIANWENTNKCLLRYSSICDGVKTGVTCTAGPCLTTSWRVKDRHFIITILKCDSLEQRYSESQRVFVWMCDKLGLELTAEERMPYEKVKQLYKRNSVESLQSLKESSMNSSTSIKQKPNLIIEKNDSVSIYENLKMITTYPELDNKSKSSFPSSQSG